MKTLQTRLLHTPWCSSRHDETRTCRIDLRAGTWLVSVTGAYGEGEPVILAHPPVVYADDNGRPAAALVTLEDAAKLAEALAEAAALASVPL